MKTIPYITQQVKTSFERKQFVEFDYLTIEPSTAAVIWVFVIVILINVGISFFVVKNEWEEDSLYRDRNW
jgi:hypothetical protein